MLLNCGVGENSWESLGLQGDQTNQSSKKSVLNIHGKDWCWSWSSNILANWHEELTDWKKPWCWERLKVGEEDNRGWDGCMASPTQWRWTWARSGRWWWTGKPGVLQSMGLQRVGHDWATELTEQAIASRDRKKFPGKLFPNKYPVICFPRSLHWETDHYFLTESQGWLFTINMASKFSLFPNQFGPLSKKGNTFWRAPEMKRKLHTSKLNIHIHLQQLVISCLALPYLTVDLEF